MLEVITNDQTQQIWEKCIQLECSEINEAQGMLFRHDIAADIDAQMLI